MSVWRNVPPSPPLNKRPIEVAFLLAERAVKQKSLAEFAQSIIKGRIPQTTPRLPHHQRTVVCCARFLRALAHRAY